MNKKITVIKVNSPEKPARCIATPSEILVELSYKKGAGLMLSAVPVVVSEDSGSRGLMTNYGLRMNVKPMKRYNSKVLEAFEVSQEQVSTLLLSVMDKISEKCGSVILNSEIENAYISKEKLANHMGV